MRRPKAAGEPGTIGDVDLYHALGGMEGCTGLATAFYARVAQDPVLCPFFPGKSFRCATEALTLLIAQFLGGPMEYSATRWWPSLGDSHLRFKIGPEERVAWLRCMRTAFEDRHVETPVGDALLHLFERSSTRIVNHGTVPAGHLQARTAHPVHPDAVRRTDAIMATEEAVAAVREGDPDRALALVEGAPLRTSLESDRAALANLLSLMAGAESGVLLAYVRTRLVDDPGLVRERYASGRTLLHRAAAIGSAPMAELLLSLGADPNATDRAGHAPLYAAGNECPAGRGADVVHTLVRAGADPDHGDGVTRATALHMAARRGNAPLAAALIDCGADLEARDRQGDTPLRRAVNCGKTAVAELLASKGADPHSKGSRDLSPLLAARTQVMRRVLVEARERPASR